MANLFKDAHLDCIMLSRICEDFVTLCHTEIALLMCWTIFVRAWKGLAYTRLLCDTLRNLRLRERHFMSNLCLRCDSGSLTAHHHLFAMLMTLPWHLCIIDQGWMTSALSMPDGDASLSPWLWAALKINAQVVLHDKLPCIDFIRPALLRDEKPF